MALTLIAFYLLMTLIVYTYLLYPALLVLLSIFFRKDLKTTGTLPSATLIISAFNEEAVIEKKLKNSLMLDYPKELLDIIVVSDNSTDKTDEIAKAYSGLGITLLRQPVRKGKTAGLNEAVQRSRGNILVFSDADSMYSSDAIRRMASYLSDPNVGLVTGSTLYAAMGDAKLAKTSGIYTQMERFSKRYESLIGSCVGADGAIFAMRRSLYLPLQNDDINDLVIPLNVVRKGHRAILHDELYCIETSSPDVHCEFNRQIRITNRTLRALFRNRDLMNFLRYPLFSLEIISHKLIRLSVPVFMLLLIPLNMVLFTEGIFYQLTLSAQVMFYAGALIGHWQEKMGNTIGVFQFLYHFALINISILIGWIKFLSGEKQVTWNAK